MPQGYPVICQAGEPEVGREFAARSADMMYGKAVSPAHAQGFYIAMKARLAKYGPKPEALKIMPGLCCVVGRTREEAQEKFDRVQSVRYRGSTGSACARRKTPSSRCWVPPAAASPLVHGETPAS